MTDSLMERRKNHAAGMTEDELIRHLTPQQQKYAHHAVLTNLSDDDIAVRLGVTKHYVRKWKKDPYVEKYIFCLQKQLLDDQFITKVKINNQQLYSKMSAELASRFETPDPNRDLGPGASDEERLMYQKRFAQNAEFKDLARVFEQFDKRVRLDTDGQATERVESSELREKMQERFMRIQMKRRRLNHELEKSGLDFTPEHMKMLEAGEDGVFREAPHEVEEDNAEYDEVIIEQYSLLREKNDKEEG